VENVSWETLSDVDPALIKDFQPSGPETNLNSWKKARSLFKPTKLRFSPEK
jgi:hypothetical protein